jgi:hypothetical protein
MTSINFDEPSAGNVSIDDAKALKIKVTGKRAIGLLCEDTSDFGSGGAIVGKSLSSIGVLGESKDEPGVKGKSKDSIGIEGDGIFGIMGSSTGAEAARRGVKGVCNGRGYGVEGYSSAGTGVYGMTGGGVDATGVTGRSDNGIGVFGFSDWKTGIVGKTDRGEVGIRGESRHINGHGIEGINTNTQKGIGVFGRGITAGRFEGDVEITGDIRLLNADCAEDFDVVDSDLKNVEPGTVMVLTENGSLQSSYEEYDKKVAGIVSGASGYKPAIILDRQNQNNNDRRLPIALMGKVYCKVDARHSSIEIGDLLTTSSTKGYAMKAKDPMRAFGAVVGKALGSIKEGIGMIPVLVTLQ